MKLDAMSELEGKTVREAASEWSRRAARDIDGKTERSNGREHMSQCGQRASFNDEVRSREDLHFIRSQVFTKSTN